MISQAKFDSIIQRLCPGKKCLIACSGGADSMVLLHLVQASSIHHEVAHVNYGLRGEESNQDKEFVVDYCEKYGIKYHLLDVTQANWDAHHGGTQEAGRSIRYQWFSKLLQQYKFDVVLTAHHADDVIETRLFHFIRSAGFKGLGSITEKSEFVIRPLLTFRKQEIVDFAQSNGIAFRTDSSNLTSQYTRNKIRHELIPLIEQIQPGFTEGQYHASALYSAMSEWAHDQLQSELSSLIRIKNGLSSIAVDELSIKNHRLLLLYHWLSPLRFSSHQIHEALQLLNATSGKKLIGSSHTLIRDREHLLLVQNEDHDFHYKVSQAPFVIDELNLEGKLLSSSEWTIQRNTSITQLNADRVEWPLIFRNWKIGDEFQPLGMSGKQKLSDLFVQLKLSLPQKNKTVVLESNGEIIAIIGLRISNKYKVEPETQKVLVISHSDLM